MDYRDENIWLMQGDCLERMREIPEGSVSLVLTDPPYGTTACKWDAVIPLEPMWEMVNRVAGDRSPIVLTCTQPFTSVLVSSNIRNFKHEWVWDKVKPGAFAIAKYRPLRQQEDIMVFSKNGESVNYYPIMVEQKHRTGKIYSVSDSAPVKYNDGIERTYKQKYPKTIITISNANQRGKVHPTQKPVELMEYLIKTYTKEGDTVLDFTAGSMSTAVACINTNRKCIMIEKDEHYYNVGKDRVMKALQDKERILGE